MNCQIQRGKRTSNSGKSNSIFFVHTSGPNLKNFCPRIMLAFRISWEIAASSCFTSWKNAASASSSSCVLWYANYNLSSWLKNKLNPSINPSGGRYPAVSPPPDGAVVPAAEAPGIEGFLLLCFLRSNVFVPRMSPPPPFTSDFRVTGILILS